MKLITFRLPSGEMRAGWLEGDKVIDMNIASNGTLPSSMLAFLEKADEYVEIAHGIRKPTSGMYTLEDVQLCAAIPNPGSIRDFYAFEQHVKTARGRRGLDIVPEWYDIPVFYFTNHRAVIGPEVTVSCPKQTQKLDYELEIACVIGKEGRNISREQAEEYIFGYCIMNDWSARDLQAEEMKVGLGPAKGKDFATSLGAYLVTKEELDVYRTGERYNLEMTAHVNGELLSKGNFRDIYYTFAEMIERASQDVTLYPGDVIGSGTVGTGCILELGTEKWLQDGDVVELTITGLGTLRNTVKKETKAGDGHVLSSHGGASS
ncbi:fumarylacetoacetate hydrolase family protein [Bacillus pseudomycoides]|uniref:fumarylacetoacetate hydrolase family protein n=1 Tax=Bacillus pseudomycoides TaxID=64104 RepID=UPI000BEDC339|nr:fumarylacetoacetate hydrolase family protein [Bacillus pseudomycoides]PED06663.1 fumarylacetoacetase [Bacillus pseudomycoides]PEI97871.1 fumarylacetoacetase [Bacillus pseudomycoides]PEK23455.1 fumarylacetoacetase [Bacillus pseudomycoides]PEM77781.1 fumarylacetoacetase [Bacillus pseudomycoides]PEO14471.1 fumarylacetoacetase [Bacillus pseudomycoides]